MEDVSVRRLDESMLDGAAELERLCFSSPWSREALKLLCSDGAVGFAAVDTNGKVVAYGGMMCVLDEGQITNIATHPDFRRRGFGLSIVNALLDYGRDNGINLFSLEVRESNSAAIALYEGLGFVGVGLRKNFYSSPTENAVVMIKEINSNSKE